MELKDVVDVCCEFTKEDWKSDEEHVYDNGRLRVVSLRDDYFGDLEMLASFDGEQFLWYRENYADSRYIKNKAFENYVNSDEFYKELAKYLLLN